MRWFDVVVAGSVKSGGLREVIGYKKWVTVSNFVWDS